MESLSATLDNIAKRVESCVFYARMYKDSLQELPPGSSNNTVIQNLDIALPEFFASVLVFLAKAQFYFKTSFTSM